MTNTIKQTPTKRAPRKTAAVKKSMTGIGTRMSESAERVADIILEDNPGEKKSKTKKITDETLTMFKSVAEQVRTNLKDVRPQDFVGDLAYGAGRISGATKRALSRLYDNLTD
ncbi:MAG: hypothetical protein HQL26_00415 [Candidatus Omnitrophica bacterium]|nr:hypothetical protein [Candidatus Omnitrophota bacterium]